MSNWKTKLDAHLHEKNCYTDILEKIEKKTNVPRLYIVLGLGAFIALWLMVGYGAQFLSNFIGFLYPAYASIKAIESKEKDDDTKWLTYWVVYSFFALVEFFSDIFLFWIPFYWLLKCIFMIYCFAPAKWNGSLTIYNRVIRPIVLKYESRIDNILNRAENLAKEGFEEGQKLASEAAEKAASEATKRHFE